MARVTVTVSPDGHRHPIQSDRKGRLYYIRCGDTVV